MHRETPRTRQYKSRAAEQQNLPPALIYRRPGRKNTRAYLAQQATFGRQPPPASRLGLEPSARAIYTNSPPSFTGVVVPLERPGGSNSQQLYKIKPVAPCLPLLGAPHPSPGGRRQRRQQRHFPWQGGDYQPRPTFRGILQRLEGTPASTAPDSYEPGGHIREAEQICRGQLKRLQDVTLLYYSWDSTASYLSCLARLGYLVVQNTQKQQKAEQKKQRKQNSSHTSPPGSRKQEAGPKTRVPGFKDARMRHFSATT